MSALRRSRHVSLARLVSLVRLADFGRVALLGLLSASLSVACSSDFRQKNEVFGVRILAARADLPYAHPGETVRIEALVHDGRANKSGEPMRTFWVPVPCVNPPGGVYYGCYPALSAFPIGVDLTPNLREGTNVSVAIPNDALNGVVMPPGGSSEPVATAFVFLVACAGHVERVPRKNGDSPNVLPIGCFTADHRQLDADNFVFGFTRVFVWNQRRNAIPSLDGVVFEGNPIDTKIGVTTGTCVEGNDGCNKVKFDVRYNDAMAELDPDAVDVDGNVQHETLYVDWFTTLGKFVENRSVVYEPTRGRLEKTEIEYEPPKEPGKGTVWAIFHDNRGGTTWTEFPLEIR